MSARTFLVTGATGNQGKATLNALLGRGHRVRALTRKPDSPAASKLRERGMEVFGGDFDDRSSLDRALSGVDGAFLVTTFAGGGATVESEIRQGRSFFDAAARSRVPHVVFTSVGGAERHTGVPHFDSKWQIEEYGRSKELPLTIVRPVMFMDLLRAPSLMRSVFMGVLQAVLGPDRPLQFIATRDIGLIAASFLDEGPGTAGTALEIAGDSLTLPGLKDVYSKSVGKPLRTMPGGRFFLRRLPQDLGKMMYWIGERGWEADIDAVRRRYPEILTVENWLKKA